MMRQLLWIVVWLSFISVVQAQDNALVAQDVIVAPETDLYGQEALYARGQLLNHSGLTYSGISLQAEAYDVSGAVVGEGFGYLVNACGEGLLPDFVLPAGATQPFAVPLELDDDSSTVDHVEITAQGTAADAAIDLTPFIALGIISAAAQEVVSLEWVDEGHLRFGVGCWRDLFSQLEWNEYDVQSGIRTAAEHPKTTLVTPALRHQLGLDDPLYFAHSFLSFPTDARRLVYQNELNTVFTAEVDGSFKRKVFETLSNRTLQGITWLKKGRFLAYYYSAYGDPVTYFTANVDGQPLSEPAPNATPSITVPGASPDGTRIVISAEVDGKTRYYLKQAAYPTTALLFEAPAPGNNWPGPLYEQDSDGSTFIYAALPKDDGAWLACFNVQSKTLHDLASLPLQLANDERAWWWLSPDANRIALAADGVHGGLWLIDLDKVGACE